MRIAVIGDVHLGCSDYTEKRISDYANKFVEAIDLALKNEVQMIALLGDIFDSSAYRRSVDAFASVLHEIAPALVRSKLRQVPIVCILGNHEFGRGREGGEVRILADLEFVHLLNDSSIDVKGVRFCGISWKNDIAQFESELQKLSKYSESSFLLIHQFVSGGHSIPDRIAELDYKRLQGWKKVFVGHHHVHESFDNICIPGSLEIHNALEIRKGIEKGFVIYETESGNEEFVKLKPSRPIKYAEIEVSNLAALEAQHRIRNWVAENAEPHALLIARLSGKLRAGRSSEISLRECKELGSQKGCVEVSIINNIEDSIRTAAEIKATMNAEQFLSDSFKKPEQEKAIEYFHQFKELGDDYIAEIKDALIEGLS
jgi:DNA repair exonuclease SbcCD nuclease subunit